MQKGNDFQSLLLVNNLPIHDTFERVERRRINAKLNNLNLFNGIIKASTKARDTSSLATSNATSRVATLFWSIASASSQAQLVA